MAVDVGVVRNGVEEDEAAVEFAAVRYGVSGGRCAFWCWVP